MGNLGFSTVGISDASFTFEQLLEMNKYVMSFS